MDTLQGVHIVNDVQTRLPIGNYIDYDSNDSEYCLIMMKKNESSRRSPNISGSPAVAAQSASIRESNLRRICGVSGIGGIGELRERLFS